MTTTQILKAQDFAEVAQVRPDEKQRVTLKKVKRASQVYKVYVNSIGQIILDPQVLVPVSEMWLFENKEALASVRRGLAQAKAGKLVKMPSLAKHAKDDIE